MVPRSLTVSRKPRILPAAQVVSPCMMVDTNAHLIVRYLKLRWWRDVEDLVAGTTAERLAFDELEIDHEIDRRERAAGREAVERFALTGLAGSDEPLLALLDVDPAPGRAFL